MGRKKCSAYNCSSSSVTSHVKFFKFPLRSRPLLRKWLSNMKWKDWTPSPSSVLCVDHFEEEHVERRGGGVRLRPDAVPTLFSFPKHMEKRKAVVNPRSRRYTPPAAAASQVDPADALQDTEAAAATPPEENQPDARTGSRIKRLAKWAVLMDEELVTIESFPYFFHGDYCIPQDIQWAPDDNFKVDCKDPENIIEVKEPWQWLCLDIRGPLPVTQNGHKYLFTITDLYSKWVEALPIQTCVSSQVTKHITDIISHFGFPVRILSRLPLELVKKINRDLKERLKIHVPLVVFHQQTGTVDLITQGSIDRMVRDLVHQHEPDWDVHLPAKVFRLCLGEHAETKEQPFSLLCCNHLVPVQTTRGHNYTYSKIQDSVFIIKAF